MFPDAFDYLHTGTQHMYRWRSQNATNRVEFLSRLSNPHVHLLVVLIVTVHPRGDITAQNAGVAAAVAEMIMGLKVPTRAPKCLRLMIILLMKNPPQDGSPRDLDRELWGEKTNSGRTSHTFQWFVERSGGDRGKAQSQAIITDKVTY